MRDVISKIERGVELTKGDLVALLDTPDGAPLDRLFHKAYETKLREVGAVVRLRGLVEVSNVCRKNCLYCGIRRDNQGLGRYTLSMAEILDAARFAHKSGFGSVVLQSGENCSESFISLIEDSLRRIKEVSGGALGVTLCCGEQDEDTYRRWFEAGAHRYLLRIETSNRELYARIHPSDHSFDRRVECLGTLKKIGYQLGTGVMSGLPGQTLEHLADDIMFFQKVDADMIGMGPYIPHHDTPMGADSESLEKIRARQLGIGLRMIAVTRIFLKDVNIASTTALQALDDEGREMGLKAGANVIMPNITDTKYRSAYKLYDNKPCLDENAELCKTCLEKRIESIGERIIRDDWGDSPHFKKSKRPL